MEDTWGEECDGCVSFGMGKPKFEINQQSRIMLDAFKQKGWIFEYLEDESRPGFYKIHRKEPRKKRT